MIFLKRLFSDLNKKDLLVRFTCKICSAANQKVISKTSYEKNTVLIKCSGCENMHIISDNFNWFGEGRNVEQMLENSVNKNK